MPIVSPLVFGVVALFPSVSCAGPHMDRPRFEATLNPDGSIVIQPGEELMLEYETQGGQIVKLKPLPLNAAGGPNRIRIALTRHEGKLTKFGDTTPIIDSLSITCYYTSKTLSARCEYTPVNSPRSIHTGLQGTRGGMGKGFRYGVQKVILSEIQFTQTR